MKKEENNEKEKINGIVESLFDHLQDKGQKKTPTSKRSKRIKTNDAKNITEILENDINRIKELEKKGDLLVALSAIGAAIDLSLKFNSDFIAKSSGELWSKMLMSILVRMEGDDLIKIK